ncbi:hypothetical protein [uncultured Intestinimonas sp.]|uniref:hypothetical protein n=1 Tax=uncultured Intestinimonas sp. TaxID=1689265 RepID=UPI0025FA9569|nr:hypothetical protein [uncultured Intestinimonas sp.]
MLTLLENLQERLGCLYLSDLHTDSFRRQALQEALDFPPDAYSFEQWQEAVRYLLGSTPPSTSVQELREMLAQCATEL